MFVFVVRKSVSATCGSPEHRRSNDLQFGGDDMSRRGRKGARPGRALTPQESTGSAATVSIAPGNMYMYIDIYTYSYIHIYIYTPIYVYTICAHIVPACGHRELWPLAPLRAFIPDGIHQVSARLE